jgi:tripartite-type tricarboxylate transporter receptor subunit TctC
VAQGQSRQDLWGHIGSGTLSHLCGLYMQATAAATWTFVPYRGAAAALQD